MTRRAQTTATATPSTPWGTCGQDVTEKFKPVRQVMREHGLDWNVSLQPLYLADGSEVPKNFATRRDSDGAILGVVGDRYTVLQNVDAFDWFDPFIESKQASIKTVGSFKGGRVIFIQAEVEIDPVEIVKGDTPIQSHMTLGHAHDGSLRVLGGFTPVRPWCINQLPMMKSSKSSKMLSMKHTKNVVLGLEAIRGIMDIHKAELNATAEQLRFLASKGVNQKSLEKYVTLVFSKEGKEQDKTKIVETIAHLFENGRGLGQSNMKNYYGMFNAVAEHLTWGAGRTVDNRLSSLWFGENHVLEQKAFQLAIDMASGKNIKVAGA